RGRPRPGDPPLQRAQADRAGSCLVNQKTFNALGVTAFVMVVLSVFVAFERPTVNFAFAKGSYLIKNLDPKEVATITIKSKNEEVKLDRMSDRFVVSSKMSYPAANKEVNSLIRDLTKIQLAAEVADRAEAHAGLGVALDSEEAKVVRFLDREGKELVGVVVGKSADGGGYNVRLTNQDQVYRTESYVYLRGRSLDYDDKELVNNERNQIEKVEVKPAAGEAYVITSPKEGEVKLEGIPDGKRAKGSTYESVFSATSWFSFEDFAPAQEKQDLDFKDVHVVTRRDGARYTFEIAKKDDKHWVRARAEYIGPERQKIAREVQQAKD